MQPLLGHRRYSSFDCIHISAAEEYGVQIIRQTFKFLADVLGIA